MPKHDTTAAQAAKHISVDRTTLVAAIKRGECAGVNMEGVWHTSMAAAREWHAQHYRHAQGARRTGDQWSEHERALLTEYLASCMTAEEAARKLERSLSAVRVAASRLGLSVQPQPELPPPAPVQEETTATSWQPEDIAAVRAYLDAETPLLRHSTGLTRQEERDGRLRVHVHPEVKAAMGQAASAAGLTLAVYLTRAGLAAAEVPDILDRGADLAARLQTD